MPIYSASGPWVGSQQIKFKPLATMEDDYKLEGDMMLPLRDIDIKREESSGPLK